MLVRSLNISPALTVLRDGREWRTGIFKKPTPNPVHLGPLGLAGDAQVNTKAHGGPHQALYAYPIEHYQYWCEHHLLDPSLGPGSLGENITVENAGDESTVCIGDTFQIGPSAVVEVTSPRLPCATLAMVVGSSALGDAFMATARVGWYLRVLAEGPIAPGDPIRPLSADPARVSIRDLMTLIKTSNADTALSARATAVPALHPRWRERLTKHTINL